MAQGFSNLAILGRQQNVLGQIDGLKVNLVQFISVGNNYSQFVPSKSIIRTLGFIYALLVGQSKPNLQV